MNRLFLPGIEEPSAELLGRAEIRLGLSEGRLTIALERGTHGLVRQQRLDEVGAPVLDRLHGRSYRLVGLRLPHHGSESYHRRLGVDDATRRVEIRAHPHRIDLEL